MSSTVTEVQLSSCQLHLPMYLICLHDIFNIVVEVISVLLLALYFELKYLRHK